MNDLWINIYLLVISIGLLYCIVRIDRLEFEIEKLKEGENK